MTERPRRAASKLHDLSALDESDEEENFEEDDGDANAGGGKAEQYCVCRGPDDGRFMIFCESCNEWYHGSCIGVRPEQAATIENFVCFRCRNVPPQQILRAHGIQADAVPFEEKKKPQRRRQDDDDEDVEEDDDDDDDDDAPSRRRKRADSEKKRKREEEIPRQALPPKKAKPEGTSTYPPYAQHIVTGPAPTYPAASPDPNLLQLMRLQQQHAQMQQQLMYQQAGQYQQPANNNQFAGLQTMLQQQQVAHQQAAGHSVHQAPTPSSNTVTMAEATHAQAPHPIPAAQPHPPPAPEQNQQTVSPTTTPAAPAVEEATDPASFIVQ